MTRRQAREVVFSLIFEADFQGNDNETENEWYARVYQTALDDFSVDSPESLPFSENEYVRSVFFGIFEKLEEIDQMISDHAVGWKLNRLSHVSHAIMRLCIYEMLYVDDVPAPVAINEAVELAKKYDHEAAAKFINGVVNAIAKEHNLIDEAK